jgi:hypothetical protein
VQRLDVEAVAGRRHPDYGARIALFAEQTQSRHAVSVHAHHHGQKSQAQYRYVPPLYD